MKILLRRAYEEPGGADGFRVLVDRLWPRGKKKADRALPEGLRLRSFTSAQLDLLGAQRLALTLSQPSNTLHSNDSQHLPRLG